MKPLDLQPLGATEEHPYSFEIASGTLLGSELLVHLERLPGLKVRSKLSFPMTDDFFAAFTYKGQTFEIDSPLARLWVSATRGCSEQTFAEVMEHVKAYRRVSVFALLLASARYLFKPIDWRPEPESLLRI